MAEPQDDTSSTPPTRPAASNARKLVTGVAVGIGSAAIVAALLYATRPKKRDR